MGRMNLKIKEKVGYDKCDNCNHRLPLKGKGECSFCGKPYGSPQEE